MPQPLKVAFYGLGPLGLATVRVVASRPDVQIVGAFDRDPEKIGTGLRNLMELGEGRQADRDAAREDRDGATVATGDGVATEVPVTSTSPPRPRTGEGVGGEGIPNIRVQDATDEALLAASPDVVVHCTGSSLGAVMPQLRQIVNAGAAIVSSCEELMFPWRRQPDQAAEIDGFAKTAGVSILGTGVNPGFAMDLLPLVLSEVAARVNGVRVTRVVNASLRRGPLQRKIGAGLSAEEFRQRVEAGTLGHVGLPESLDMLAAGLGWKLGEREEVLEPVLATEQVVTDFVDVPAGAVAGIHQVTRATSDDGCEIRLELNMYVGATNPRDEIKLDGDPPLHLIVQGGIFGDTATAAILANAIPAVHVAAPGLRTMLDMPPMPSRS